MATLEQGKALVVIEKAAAELLGVRLVDGFNAAVSWVDSSHLVAYNAVGCTYEAPTVDIVAVVKKFKELEGEAALSSSEGPVSLGHTPLHAASSDLQTISTLGKQQGEILSMMKAFRLEGMEMKSNFKKVAQRVDNLESGGKADPPWGGADPFQRKGPSGAEFSGLAGQGHLWDEIDGGEAASSEDDFMEKARPPAGGLGGSRQRSRQPFPDLGQASSAATGMPPGPGDPASVNTLCMLELLKAVKRMNKKRESSDSESSDSSIGRGKGFGDLHGVHRRLKTKPQRTIRGYKQFVTDQLGITSRHQYWTYRDFSRRVQGKFGSLKSLFRIHYYLSEILQTSQDGHGEEAEAMVIQLLKALLQVAVDKGDWQNAELLMPSQPHGRVHFGGDEREMQAVFKYQKSLRELRAKNLRTENKDDEDSGKEDADYKKKKKPKGKGKDKGEEDTQK